MVDQKIFRGDDLMTSKPAPKSSQKNLLPVVLMALWLVALTALFFMFLTPTKNISERIDKLETRSATVGGKISTAGGDQIADLAKKIAGFEKRFEELDKKLSAENAEQSKKLDALADRLDKTEACCGGKPSAAVRLPKNEEKLAAAPVSDKPKAKAVRKKVAKKKRRSEPAISYGDAPIYPAYSPQPQTLPIENVPKSEPMYSERNYSMKVNHGDSLYDISRRTIPASGLPVGYMEPVKKLAPGAAIYPARSSGFGK